MNNKSLPPAELRNITLRRDGKGALKFTGERIGSVTRIQELQDSDNEWRNYEVSAKLFKSSGGKYIVGLSVYNQTDEKYSYRGGEVSDSLESLLTTINGNFAFKSWMDDDILGELFENTEIANQFVEEVD